MAGGGGSVGQEIEGTLGAAGGARVMRPWTGVRLGELRKVFGPAWLVMMADVDAASIITAMQTGAAFKYEFIAILLLLTIPLYFICEVAGRVGSVTGKGLGQLIRENFSRRLAVVFSLPMAVTDFLSYVAEYAGIAVGATILGISPFVVLPVAYLVHIALVYRRRYASAEKILLLVSTVMVVAYLAFMRGGVPSGYSLFPSHLSRGFLFLVAANVGAVIMPFMLFYQTTATAQKEFRSVQATKIETFLGAILSEVLMVAVVMVSSTLAPTLNLTTDHEIAHAIMTIGGAFAPVIFSVGLIAAGFLALVVISMAGAWGMTEALNLKGDTWFKIYIAESLPAVIVPLVFGNLIALILGLMVALVFVLIGPVVVLGLLAQNRRLMGAHALNRFDRAAFWSSVGIVIACGLVAFL